MNEDKVLEVFDMKVREKCPTCHTKGRTQKEIEEENLLEDRVKSSSITTNGQSASLSWW
jgi:hypothetical protein